MSSPNGPAPKRLTMTEDKPLQQAMRRSALRLITASRVRSCHGGSAVR